MISRAVFFKLVQQQFHSSHHELFFIEQIFASIMKDSERNHADRRVVKLTLTKNGEKTAMAHHERRAKALTQLMELLTPEEQESLILIL